MESGAAPKASGRPQSHRTGSPGDSGVRRFRRARREGGSRGRIQIGVSRGLGGEALYGLPGNFDRFLARRWVTHIGAKAGKELIYGRIHCKIALR